MGAFFRLDWLGADRVVDYSRAIAIFYAPILVILLLIASDTLKVLPSVTSTDFISFWAASKLILSGSNPYDQTALFALQDGSKYAFFYPPPFLFPILPFGWFSYAVALYLWVVLGILLIALLGRKISPSIWPILAFPPLLINAAHGQNGALTAALFLGATSIIDKRPFFAGLLLGCFVIKPHLAILFPFAFLCGKRWYVIAGGTLSALLVIAASYLAFGASVWNEFLANSGQATAHLEHNPLLHPKLASIFGMLRTICVPLPFSYAAQTALAIAAATCVSIAWIRYESPFGMAVLATGAALATPFIYSYDLVFLIVPLVWLARDGLNRGFRPWVKTIMAIAFWMPLADRVFGIYFGLNPAFFANALLMVALFRQRARWHSGK